MQQGGQWAGVRVRRVVLISHYYIWRLDSYMSTS